jgi:hypothetical protein
MESCRSVFLANLDSVMTRRYPGALWQVARASVQLARAAHLDSPIWGVVVKCPRH